MNKPVPLWRPLAVIACGAAFVLLAALLVDTTNLAPSFLLASWGLLVIALAGWALVRRHHQITGRPAWLTRYDSRRRGRRGHR